MNLSEKEIIQIIQTYYSDSSNQYAILLNGEWGCGKTFFVKNKILTEVEDSVYVSLYGVSNTNEINKKILYSIMNKKMKINNNLKKGGRIVGNSYKNFSSAITTIFKIPLPDAKNIDITDLIGNFIDVSKKLIIFDDLERVNIPINEVLGFINDYVEHKNVKCIIVANEKEIEKLNIDNNYELKIISCLNNNIEYGENDKTNSWKSDDKPSKVKIEDVKKRVSKTYNTENKYKLIKEKLIGKTIDYVPDIEKIINGLLNNYKKNTKYYNFLKSQKNLLIDILKKDNCYNIRTIIFLLNEFKNIFSQVEKQKYLEKENKILELTFINTIHMSILLKNGYDIEKKLNGIMYSNAVSFREDGLSKMSDYFTAFDFINDYLCSSNLNINKMKKTLSHYIEVEIENALQNSDPLLKLETYWELEDEEVNECLDTIISNFNYGHQIFPKMLRILSGLKVIQIATDKIEIIINKMKEELINNSVDYLDLHAMLTEKETVEIYNSYALDFKNILKDNKLKNSTKKIDNILKNENWGEKLYNEYIKDNVIYDGFLCNLNIDDIISNITVGNTKNVFFFKYTIDNVYHFGNIKDFYLMDKENLEYLLSELKKLDDKSFGKMKIYAIKILITVLEEKLLLLEK